MNNPNPDQDPDPFENYLSSFDEYCDWCENNFDFNDGLDSNANSPFQGPQLTSDQKSLTRRNSSSRQKIDLSSDANDLKSRYYSIFTDRKAFPKKKLYLIQKYVLAPQIGLRNMIRDEIRQKDLYFQNFAKFKDKILLCLELNKKMILSTYLSDVKKLKNKRK